jgi:NAD(P)H dehydrogenase (quinone)
MYAITGITGKVGGELAQTLLAAGQPVRAVVRDARKGEAWAALGCRVAVAEMADAPALTAAFRGAKAVFILPPSEFDPQPGYPEARAVIDSVVAALAAGKPPKVLCLSTVGADATTDNLLSQRGMLEAALRELRLPLTILRPAWYLDTTAWDVTSARETGLIHSFLIPTERAIPMVAAKDVGRVAAELIQEEWTGTRVVELEGPRRVTPNQLADALAGAIGGPVRAVPSTAGLLGGSVPRAGHEKPRTPDADARRFQ